MMTTTMLTLVAHDAAAMAAAAAASDDDCEIFARRRSATLAPGSETARRAHASDQKIERNSRDCDHSSESALATNELAHLQQELNDEDY